MNVQTKPIRGVALKIEEDWFMGRFPKLPVKIATWCPPDKPFDDPYIYVNNPKTGQDLKAKLGDYIITLEKTDEVIVVTEEEFRKKFFIDLAD